MRQRSAWNSVESTGAFWAPSGAAAARRERAIDQERWSMERPREGCGETEVLYRAGAEAGRGGRMAGWAGWRDVKREGSLAPPSRIPRIPLYPADPALALRQR